MFHHLGETHTHNGDPAWSCCCGTSICSCLSGFLLETLPLYGATPPRAPSLLHSHFTGSGKFTHADRQSLSLSLPSLSHTYTHPCFTTHPLPRERKRNRKGLIKQRDFFSNSVQNTVVTNNTNTLFSSRCSDLISKEFFTCWGQTDHLPSPAQTTLSYTVIDSFIFVYRKKIFCKIPFIGCRCVPRKKNITLHERKMVKERLRERGAAVLKWTETESLPTIQPF